MIMYVEMSSYSSPKCCTCTTWQMRLKIWEFGNNCAKHPFVRTYVQRRMGPRVWSLKVGLNRFVDDRIA